MYERNAIVLERYFNQMFGYNLKNNIKANFSDYCEFIDCLEKYRQISEEEESVVGEYDLIASKITEVQQNQEVLNKKYEKLQKLRMEIFQNIDDNSESIQRKIHDINNSIQEINEAIKENAEKFVDYVGKFNEKTSVRTKCEKSMRTIETEYNKRLNNMLDNYKDIDIVIEKKAKEFIDSDTKEIEYELKSKIEKNGEKEKIPFSSEVVEKAISLCIQIQKNENRIFVNIYDKCNKLFNEIKNNTIKVEKHNKTIKDSKNELEFLNAMKEYLVQFLDNERLTAVNGEKDHNSLMKEACKNLDKDWTQINNLYTLLKKEITNKANKKAYTDLYNIGYLKELEKIAEEFDIQIKKLNLPVTIINPNYWRIEGMKKIYDVFNNCVTDNYGRNIFEFIPIEEDKAENEGIEEVVSDTEIMDINSKNIDKTKVIEEKNADSQNEINKKIDLILGYNESNEDEDEDDEEDDDTEKNISNVENIKNEDTEEDEDAEEDDDAEEEEDAYDDENDDDDYYDTNWDFETDNNTEDKWEEDDKEFIWDKDEEQDEFNDDWNDDEFNDEWDNNENPIEDYSSFIYGNKTNEEQENDIEVEDYEEENSKLKDDEEIFEDSYKKLSKKEKKNNNKKKKEQEEIEEEAKSDKKKGKHTKKGGFFSKFKK